VKPTPGKTIFLKTGNLEVDRRVGGFPAPSLNLLEGPNDSGKSVFAQQLAKGVLDSSIKVNYITTETTIKRLLSQMASLSFDVTYHYLMGLFKITPLHVTGINWNPEIAKNHLNVMLRYLENRDRSDVVIIDSLTYIVTHAEQRDILDFFSRCRNLVDEKEKTIFFTLHPYAFESDLLIRIRSICDGHIEFVIKEVRGKTVRFIKIAKLKGASKASDSMIGFEVDPAFGIKILPFSQAKA